MTIDVSKYKHIVVLTGAGISTASGLHTYRGEGGIWETFDVEQYGHADRLNDKPEHIWALFGPLRVQLKEATPNPAHYILVELEKHLDAAQEFTLITQNIDGLHQQAGSKNLIELHGSVRYSKCANPDCDLDLFRDEETYQAHTPFCSKCAAPLRPDIVLFGEQIPAKQDWLSKRALRECDLFISIGTSGSVYPAANFVRAAEYAGARTIYINLDPMTPPNPAYKEEYLGKAEALLPELFNVAINKDNLA